MLYSIEHSAEHSVIKDTVKKSNIQAEFRLLKYKYRYLEMMYRWKRRRNKDRR